MGKIKTSGEVRKRGKGKQSAVTGKETRIPYMDKFSPTWIVVHAKDAPAYQLELIDRIRRGVKKLTGSI